MYLKLTPDRLAAIEPIISRLDAITPNAGIEVTDSSPIACERLRQLLYAYFTAHNLKGRYKIKRLTPTAFHISLRIDAQLSACVSLPTLTTAEQLVFDAIADELSVEQFESKLDSESFSDIEKQSMIKLFKSKR